MRVMIEAGLSNSYAQCSSGEVGAIQARYEKARELAVLREGVSWLDIGTNMGRGLPNLEVSGLRVTAIDRVESYLKEAVSKNEHVQGCVMDGCRLGFADSSFEVVSIFEVIEHMDEGNQRKLLAEASRVLKPGGLLFLSTPNKEASGKRRLCVDHVKELTRQELGSLLIGSGFEIKTILGQAFFNGKLTDNIFRKARENPFLSLVYYRLMPWYARQKIKNLLVKAQAGEEVREVDSKEIPRLFFMVCRKKEQ